MKLAQQIMALVFSKGDSVVIYTEMQGWDFEFFVSLESVSVTAFCNIL